MSSSIPGILSLALAEQVLAEANSRIEALSKENALLEAENQRLRDVAAIAMIQKETDKELDRPWKNYAHGLYEYIETVCVAYNSGLDDGLAAKPLVYPHTQEHPDQNAAYEIGHVFGTTRHSSRDAGASTEAPMSGSERQIAGKVFAYLEAKSSKPHAPGHRHHKPGIWNPSNAPDIAGKPCEWCALWNQFAAMVQPAALGTELMTDTACKKGEAS